MPRLQYRSSPWLQFLLVPLLLVACQDRETVPAGSTALPEPPLLALSLAPADIKLGETAQLQWSSERADRCEASGAWSGPRQGSGSEAVTPADTGIYDYQLTCSGAGGNVLRAVTLQVFPQPPSPPADPGDDVALVFSASPAEIPLGLKVLLSWAAINADSCAASGDWSGARTSAGDELLQPAAVRVHSYTLRCTGEGAPAETTVTVNVLPAPPPPEDFAAAQAEFQRLRNLEQALSTP